MKRIIIFVKSLAFIVLLLEFSGLNAQGIDSSKYKTEYFQIIDFNDFQSARLAEVLLLELNLQREKQGVDTLSSLQFLTFAAEDQAQYCAQIDNVTILQSGSKKKDTGKRSIYYGGSKNAFEMIDKTNVKDGSVYKNYQQVAEDIVVKIMTNQKKMDVAFNQLWIFAGIGAAIDPSGKKLYYSMVFGDYSSFNEGAARKNELDIPFSKKRYGLFPYDEKACKKYDKNKMLAELQKGLYVKDDKVYFKSDKYKEIQKILKDSKDGIGVDIVQRDQYPCVGSNIVDNNLVNKGVMVKRIWSSKMLKKNLVVGDKERKKNVDVLIGKLPAAIAKLDKDQYEMNLVFIKDKYVCKNIPPSYIEAGGVEYNNLLELLADTVNPPGTEEYSPRATKSTLSFKIPFEKGKSVYKQEDIDPFIKALKEPEFIINELNISAYSSIEGTDEINRSLQLKRAESIKNALQAKHKDKIISNVTTADNWEEFKRDVAGTEFSNLAGMTMEEAQKNIRENSLDKKLENILKNHRYAKIDMKITYDIDGDKEQAYVVKMFNDAVKKGDYIEALRVQKYLFKQVVAKKYTKEAVFEMEIPESQATAGLAMNKLWLEQFVNNGDVDEDCCSRVENLNQLDPSNQYILFNNLYCNFIYAPLGDEEHVRKIQEIIDGMYNKALSKKTIDMLNLEYQMTIIKTLDTLDDPGPLFAESMERIKTIVDIKESNWQNSLKLAYVFMGNNDYEFAARLLEPFVNGKYVFEELVFAYISLCTKTEEKLYTSTFTKAVTKAIEQNPERFCNLINKGKLTFQVFENEKVKEMYCKKCKSTD
ncbi:MAG: hypothetical protein A2W91_20330 [Bacteroidetes bacterium GWF2_38_335]|nr:MAG: hypothetical protein A2W91_20330 [Bacteroidetes bacterium GWF2_38_335]OFY79491.1 MAG: hypothetical protein A2281_13755 [Bacteroidetes bacterium RIFOXYA12_FULL_38_20]HBS86570.1 hypothetical protein [Bacteroidales bacterium]